MLPLFSTVRQCFSNVFRVVVRFVVSTGSDVDSQQRRVPPFVDESMEWEWARVMGHEEGLLLIFIVLCLYIGFLPKYPSSLIWPVHRSLGLPNF